MSKGLKAVFISILALFIFSATAYAASSKFLPEAQKYYNKECKQRKVDKDEAMFCYLFEKSNEMQLAVNNLSSILDDVKNDTDTHTIEIDVLEEVIASQGAVIRDLTEKIEKLEEQHEDKLITFAKNRPQPFDSEWHNVEGYSSLTVNLSISGSIAGYSIHYTDNPNIPGFTEQKRVDCNSNECPETTVHIIGKYYRISTGTASGNVTSTGLLTP